eukprot:10130167-Alexandrium_andersonii.AAC.1
MCHAGDPPCPLTWGQLRAGEALQGVVLASRRRPAGGRGTLQGRFVERAVAGQPSPPSGAGE